MRLHAHAQINFVTSVFCMVQCIYIVINPHENFEHFQINIQKIKRSKKIRQTKGALSCRDANLWHL